jgi:hypothetical protein
MCTPYLLSAVRALGNFWDDKDEQNTAAQNNLLPAFSTTAASSRSPDPYAPATKGICDSLAFQCNQPATTTSCHPSDRQLPSSATSTFCHPSDRQLPPATTTSCDNYGFLRHRHRPDVQVKQHCSDNYETKQPLTTTTCSDPIGAVLDSFGRLYEFAEPKDQTKQTKTYRFFSPLSL